jgi:excisionase family DNA binding protein
MNFSIKHPAILAASAALATDDPKFSDPKRLVSAIKLMVDAEQSAMEPVKMKLLSMKEAAKRLMVCKRTVGNWVASGRLPAIKQGKTYVRILETDLAYFVENMDDRPVTIGIDKKDKKGQ